MKKAYFSRFILLFLLNFYHNSKMNKLHSFKKYSFKQEIQFLGVYTREISILKPNDVGAGISLC